MIQLVFASASQTLEKDAPDSIVYLPKGDWEITPTVNGKPEKISVFVDADSAKVLQQSLDERLRGTVRPHAAFDHRPGPASFLPKQFKWDDEKGVLLEVEWTQSGKQAVAGKDYSYFSPTFLLRDKKVVGLPEDGEIGSLTNNPAFRKIQRIAASTDATKGKTMTKLAEKLAELKVITAQQAESEDEDFLVRAVDGLFASLVLAQRANDMLKAENTDLNLKVQAIKATEADKVIEDAIKAGKFPAKDAETIQFFKEQYLAHPEQTKKVLAALAGSPVLGDPIVKVTSDPRVMGGMTNGSQIIEAQKALVREIKEANPSMSNETAFNKAKSQRPELFVEA